ncbi:Polysulphide reductase, NrfD [Thermomonospora echinospora]|uniref:Polysulphide reductase, NrfD n=1 Tax=Thermomonospora echinospora TaxID=1992 RepID=A0A1H5VI04_9ACTN|nr:NrfD/PsrC family molybdoenzyme membrane anchor subunit [Thermomonospora echinospora]SEF86864.1 Polysulphide reductase, NrfD [Thermomonospora echinospora]
MTAPDPRDSDPRDREALTGVAAGRRRRRERRGEQPMVPKAEFTSYYGRPVIKPPVWKPLDIAGYLFLGGLAGASSALAAGAGLTGRPTLARNAQVAAVGAIGLSVVALVHDLGRPARFVNMLRVAKPSSPMSVGSWLLSVYGPLAGGAAVSTVTGRLPRLGLLAGLGAAVTGPAVAGYTAVLFADTAVPAWHDGHRELPFLFVGSAAVAAGGLGLATAPLRETWPARFLACAGAVTELTASRLMNRRLGMVAEPYRTGRGGRLMRIAETLTVAGIATAVLGHRSRALSALAGTALLTASAATRFGVFEAGMDSARDPKYTSLPQRERLRAGEGSRAVTG